MTDHTKALADALGLLECKLRLAANMTTQDERGTRIVEWVTLLADEARDALAAYRAAQQAPSLTVGEGTAEGGAEDSPELAARRTEFEEWLADQCDPDPRSSITKEQALGREISGIYAMQETDYAWFIWRAAAARALASNASAATSAAHAAILRALDEAGVRDGVLRGMCIDVGIDAFHGVIRGESPSKPAAQAEPTASQLADALEAFNAAEFDTNISRMRAAWRVLANRPSNPPAQGVDERAAFEAWSKSSGFATERVPGKDVYASSFTAYHWNAWQARAALTQAPAAEPLGASIAPEHDERLAKMAADAEARFAADMRDAARYRWLRAQAGASVTVTKALPFPGNHIKRRPCSMTKYIFARGAELDAHIDAEIAA
jgi:hypothetical protein